MGSAGILNSGTKWIYIRIVDCLALETPFKISFIVCSKKLLCYDACMFAMLMLRTSQNMYKLMLS